MTCMLSLSRYALLMFAMRAQEQFIKVQLICCLYIMLHEVLCTHTLYQGL